ncbi:HVO_0476 family zinc finger protein [Halobacterium yunchengense]|uniref:HVO_0476 family zinc finger protein n=1 Tax=Halobacterium yunchengense TaxID=3108497 RepID=UPI003009038B
MSENVGESTPLECPSCSPDLETVHEVLTTGGGQATVQCTDCGHVHKEALDDEAGVAVDVVVSQDDESFTGTVEFDPGETVYEGDEFVVETEETIAVARVTSIETGPEERTTRADAEDVETVWTRAVGNVSVDVTVHPQDGAREDSRGLTVHVPGDYEFTVGASESFGDEEFEVTGVHVRENAVDDYKFPKLGEDGDTVFAKDVKRVYGEDESSTAWSAW